MIIVMRFRGSRRGRSFGMRPVIQSFKMIVNQAPASVAAATNFIMQISIGEDSAAAGQTSAVDTGVPTGSIIKYIDIRIGVMNIVENPAFAHVAIQYRPTGDPTVVPNVVGGNPSRNHILLQDLFTVGQNQNVNRIYRFKIPKSMQRVREGDRWQISIICNQAMNIAGQFIYKFYR